MIRNDTVWRVYETCSTCFMPSMVCGVHVNSVNHHKSSQSKWWRARRTYVTLSRDAYIGPL